MSEPTARQSHIDQALTNVSIGYTNAAYVFPEVFPLVPVTKITNKYFVFDKSAWFRNDAGPRAPGTRAPRADYTLSTGQYLCVEQAQAKQVTDEEVDNSDDPLQPLVSATRFVTDKIMMKQEVDVLGLVFGTGWASSATPSPVWSDNASTPLEDIETGMNTVATAIGREPNVGVIGRGAWRYLKNHPDIVDRLKYGASGDNPAIVTPNAVAALVGLEKLLIARAVYESATEGKTSSMAYIAGTHMALIYVPKAAALGEPSAGYTFQYKNREISRFREEQERQDIVEGRASWDAKLTATDAGYLLKSIA